MSLPSGEAPAPRDQPGEPQPGGLKEQRVAHGEHGFQERALRYFLGVEEHAVGATGLMMAGRGHRTKCMPRVRARSCRPGPGGGFPVVNSQRMAQGLLPHRTLHQAVWLSDRFWRGTTRRKERLGQERGPRPTGIPASGGLRTSAPQHRNTIALRAVLRKP